MSGMCFSIPGTQPSPKRLGELVRYLPAAKWRKGLSCTSEGWSENEFFFDDVISACGCKDRTKTQLQKQIMWRHVKILTIVLKTNK